MTDRPAKEDAVNESPVAAFATHGAPLVLKHDGDSIFHGQRIGRLQAEVQITELTRPRGYPEFNGKQEPSMPDIRSFQRAMRRHDVSGMLQQRLNITVRGLNEDRPRPLLGGRMAREASEQDPAALPDRTAFIQQVDRRANALRRGARSRRELQAARRRAVEEVLYGIQSHAGTE